MLHRMTTTDRAANQSDWCGPAAVSILTGKPLGEVTQRFAQSMGRAYSEVEGTYEGDVQLVLHSYGYRAEEMDLVSRYPDRIQGITLPRFMRERRGIEMVTPMLVEVPGHWICVHMNYVADNSTGGPVPLEQFPKNQRIVSSAYKVTPILH